MSTLKIQKATRKNVKIKLAITGLSGAGKAEGALILAEQLVPGGRVLVLDTENESASLYSDRHDFDVINLVPPFESKVFIEGVNMGVAEGYDVVIVDSMSHEWDGPGGILDRKSAEERAKPGSNGFAVWAKYKEEHRKFIANLLQAPVHIIACIRSKQEHVQTARRS